MRVLPVRHVPVVIGLLAVCLTLYQSAASINLRITDRAQIQIAQILKDRKSRRVVYCGPWVAELALAMRFLNQDSRTIMIRGDKLDPAIFTPEEFERFAWRYGVDTVVIEPAQYLEPLDPSRSAVEPTRRVPIPEHVACWSRPDHDERRQ